MLYECRILSLLLNILPLPLSAFDGEHCYEPYLPHGNFSSSDITFPLGTVVTFSCSPGFVMEQGSGVMECVDPNDPHWNESEPVCRGMTSHIYSIFTPPFMNLCSVRFFIFLLKKLIPFSKDTIDQK